MFKTLALFLVFVFIVFVSGAQKTISGVVTEEIKTKDGTVKIMHTVHLPKGKIISGTIVFDTETKNPKKEHKRLRVLGGLAFQLGNEFIPENGVFTASLPDSETTSLKVFSENGKLIEDILLELSDPAENLDLDVPKTLQAGNIEKITGNFSGDITEAVVAVNDKPLNVVAGNESELFFETTGVEPGKQQLSLDYDKIKASQEINVVDYTLEAGRLNLNRGESTYLEVKITGLEDVQESLQLEIKNQSAGTISIEGGDVQLIQIIPEEVAETGMWEKRFDIQSIARGSFSVSTDLTVLEEEETKPEDAAKYVEEAVAYEAKVFKVGKMKLVNPTNKTINAGLQSFYIPAVNGHQGYMVPDEQEFNLPPNSEIWVDIEGYCTDFDLPAPEAGSQLPPASEWFQIETPDNVNRIQQLMIQEDIQKRTLTDLTVPLNVPGTHIPITHSVGSEGDSELYQRLLIIGLTEIIDAFNLLEEEGQIQNAFFENNKEKTVQTAFWEYAENLKGKQPDKKVLVNKLEPQNSENIWKNIELIGDKAKIYPEKEKKYLAQCEFICPQNNSQITPEKVCFEWNCPDKTEGPFELTLIPETGTELKFGNIEGFNFSLDEALVSGMNYEAVLSCHSPSGILTIPPVLFSVNPDCMEDLQEIMAKLDSVRQLVEDARNELEGNPLVAESRLIQMIADILETPETITDLFDEWLAEEFSFPDISDSATFESVTRDICGNLKNIKKALEYGKKIAGFMQSQGQGNTSSLTSKIDLALGKLEKACENVDKFEAFYAELELAVNDLRGFLAGKMEDFVSERIQDTIRRVLVNKMGAAAAGSIMSMAMDAWNFIDALIKQGKLEEAKALYNTMYFRMLQLTYECSRWKINDTWNSSENGYPQIEWADCRAVQDSTVKLEAILKCWQQEEGEPANMGEFSSETLKLREPRDNDDDENEYKNELVRENFRSDCDNCCAFQFQLDMNDLRRKASNCEHAHVMIRVTIGNDEPKYVMAGVFNP